MSTLWCISASGGAMKPAASNAQPKLHITVAMMSCNLFINNDCFHINDNLNNLRSSAPLGAFI
jgi:hypothetical protein